jgi:hypothetical protein
LLNLYKLRLTEVNGLQIRISKLEEE